MRLDCVYCSIHAIAPGGGRFCGSTLTSDALNGGMYSCEACRSALLIDVIQLWSTVATASVLRDTDVLLNVALWIHGCVGSLAMSSMSWKSTMVPLSFRVAFVTLWRSFSLDAANLPSSSTQSI